MKLPEKLMKLEREYIEARALMMRDSSVYAEVKILKVASKDKQSKGKGKL